MEEAVFAVGLFVLFLSLGVRILVEVPREREPFIERLTNYGITIGISSMFLSVCVMLYRYLP